MNDVQMSKDGKHWEPAIPEKYHPDLLEKIWHKLGGHIWEVFRPKCVICGKKK